MKVKINIEILDENDEMLTTSSSLLFESAYQELDKMERFIKNNYE